MKFNDANDVFSMGQTPKEFLTYLQLKGDRRCQSCGIVSEVGVYPCQFCGRACDAIGSRFVLNTIELFALERVAGMEGFPRIFQSGYGATSGQLCTPSGTPLFSYTADVDGPSRPITMASFGGEW